MYNPNYYPNVQPSYFNPQMSFAQPQPQMQPMQDSNYQNNGSGIIWVQGEAAAKAYPVVKNCAVALWDSESQTIYIKSTDNAGMPTMRILDWTERQAQKNASENISANPTDYVTRKEFDDVVRKINNIANKMGNGKQKFTNANNSDKEETVNG